MATSKKPGDTTDPVTNPTNPAADSYSEAQEDDESSIVTGLAKKQINKSTEAAPEVSQGAWRERVFTPRGVMSKDDIHAALGTGLKVALGVANHPRVAYEEVRKAWVPVLRQALEQAGGDGIDVFLLLLLKGTKKNPMDSMWNALVQGFDRLKKVKDLAQFEADAQQVINAVRASLTALRPRRLSFKQMERELEGKIEVDELLMIAISDDAELSRRVAEIGSTMEQLRDQIKSRPGKAPGGMYANFARLKAEFRVLEGEQKRRGSLPKP